MAPRSTAVTVSKTNDIFEWNKKKLLGHLLAMEEHLNELDESDVPNSWCLKKHWTEAVYHHLSEAITNVERLGFDMKPYLAFRKKIMALHIYPTPNLTEKDVMELRTEWRRIIGDPTLGNNCPLCKHDVPQDMIDALEVEAPSQPHVPEEGDSRLGGKLLKIEASYTKRILDEIAKHRREKPAPFMLVDCGETDPSGKALATTNERGEPFMALCAGGVNAHALLHEVDHIERHNDGECRMGGCSERKAEDVAIQTMRRKLSISNALNTHLPGGGSGKYMTNKAEVIGVYGAAVAADWVKKNLPAYVDSGSLIMGQKPSFIIEAALGVLPPALMLMNKKVPFIPAKYEIPFMVFSAGLLSDVLWRFIAGGTQVPPYSAPLATRNYVGSPPVYNGSGGATIV